MAFQTGTPVDPRLGRADVSGFARAGMITGQALANLGRDIGEGIEKYQKNKQITATSLAQLEAIGSARPDAYAALKTAGGDVSQSISNIEKGDYKQKDVLAALGAINTYLGTQEAAQQSRISALQLEALEAGAEARKQPVTPFEPRTRKINGVTYVEVQQGEFEPLKKPTPTTTAGESIIGRKVTMDELNQLRDEGYKPTVKFDSGGEMIMTDLGTFAPQDTVTEPLTPAQEELEVGIAETLKAWPIGERAQAVKNLATYDRVTNQLLSGEASTRTLADLFTPSALGIDDAVRAVFNPTGQDALDNIREVVFQGLKDTLGGAFSEGEAQRLVAASYNPALSEEMNIERLREARDVLANVIAAKDDMYNYIAGGGRIADYKGVTPAAVLSSGTKDVEAKYDADPEKGGFQAPSGITIRVKSKRPTK